MFNARKKVAEGIVDAGYVTIDEARQLWARFDKLESLQTLVRDALRIAHDHGYYSGREGHYNERFSEEDREEGMVTFRVKKEDLGTLAWLAYEGFKQSTIEDRKETSPEDWIDMERFESWSNIIGGAEITSGDLSSVGKLSELEPTAENRFHLLMLVEADRKAKLEKKSQ